MRLAIIIFLILFVAAFLWILGSFAFVLWRRKARGPHFPDRNDVRILFEERWTSGRSNKSLFTRLGGANNCLHVTITDDELWMTPHFPFSALAARFDLDHRISREVITNVEQAGRTVEVTFATADGDERSITLRLRNAEEFYATLKL